MLVHAVGHVVHVVTGVGVVAHGLGDVLAPFGEPVGHRLDLGGLGGADVLGELLDLGVEGPAEGQVDHRQRLGVVGDHVGGEGDVGVVVLGGADLGRLSAACVGVVAAGGEAGTEREGEGERAEGAGTGVGLGVHGSTPDVRWVLWAGGSDTQPWSPPGRRRWRVAVGPVST